MSSTSEEKKPQDTETSKGTTAKSEVVDLLDPKKVSSGVIYINFEVTKFVSVSRKQLVC